jgi:hypothetical protein
VVASRRTHESSLPKFGAARAPDIGIAAIVKNSGLTRQTVYRMKEDPVAAEAALAAWEVAKSKSRQTSGYWALEAFS